MLKSFKISLGLVLSLLVISGIAWLMVGFGCTLSQWLESLKYIGFAIGGLAVGIGVVALIIWCFTN